MKSIDCILYEVYYPLSYEGDIGGQLNQYVRYIHSYPKLTILIKTSTNNHSRKSVVLESSVKPSLGCQFGSQCSVWQDIELFGIKMYAKFLMPNPDMVFFSQITANILFRKIFISEFFITMGLFPFNVILFRKQLNISLSWYILISR